MDVSGNSLGGRFLGEGVNVLHVGDAATKSDQLMATNCRQCFDDMHVA